MKITNELLRDTALYVEKYMKENDNSLLVYHNYTHTLNVVRACDIISMNCELGRQDRMAIHLAAWFHDIGYFTNPHDHEVTGAAMAVDYFIEKGLDKDTIADIEDCILATRLPQQPTTLMAQVICDADLHHLGTKEEAHDSSLLRQEFLVFKDKVFTDEEWIRFNLDFLKNHIYFTNFARKEFETQKRKNITSLETQLQHLIAPENEIQETSKDPISNESEINEKEIKLERGVETFFKITSGNQMKLNFMADKKANIIISINTLIISVVLSLLGPKLDTNPQLILPLLLLLIPCVIAILLGVIATRPKIMKTKPVTEPLEKTATNLMFFGTFNNMSLDEFNNSVKDLMYKRDDLYEEMTKDIYFLGKILAKKYRLIAMGYLVFMIGLIISVISFITIFIINAPK